MNTFLPVADFDESARCLDRARLGKQRVEVLQLLKGFWINHPASKMWRGYEGSLAWYGLVICNEWVSRGYNDTCFQKIRELREPDLDRFPPWFGDEAFHASHRSNLLRKDIRHYSTFGWTESPDLPYIWPISS